MSGILDILKCDRQTVKMLRRDNDIFFFSFTSSKGNIQLWEGHRGISVWNSNELLAFSCAPRKKFVRSLYDHGDLKALGGMSTGKRPITYSTLGMVYLAGMWFHSENEFLISSCRNIVVAKSMYFVLKQPVFVAL